ncbi:MAG: L-serine ammonia-lyase [Acidobacteriaceae bacterium]|nr:L-serine ammonia-lyase [Acidobacteriaceae bacterium]
MVIQEIPTIRIPETLGSCPFAPEAVAPGREFASAFSLSTPGFTPTSVLIELFGALAHPAAAESITNGILLGLAGTDPRHFAPGETIQAIRATRSIQLNNSIEVPYVPSEHLILHPAGLTAAHSEGIRLTAYHCVHPFVTRQFYATTSPKPSAQTSGNTLSFFECE